MVIIDEGSFYEVGEIFICSMANHSKYYTKLVHFVRLIPLEFLCCNAEIPTLYTILLLESQYVHSKHDS